jgi:hypothetical protein
MWPVVPGHWTTLPLLRPWQFGYWGERVVFVFGFGNAMRFHLVAQHSERLACFINRVNRIECNSKINKSNVHQCSAITKDCRFGERGVAKLLGCTWIILVILLFAPNIPKFGRLEKFRQVWTDFLPSFQDVCFNDTLFIGYDECRL